MARPPCLPAPRFPTDPKVRILAEARKRVESDRLRFEGAIGTSPLEPEQVPSRPRIRPEMDVRVPREQAPDPDSVGLRLAVGSEEASGVVQGCQGLQAGIVELVPAQGRPARAKRCGPVR